MSINAYEIRKSFLDFFAGKGHQIVPSAPIVVKNDPTLMFTNAGMNQFKDLFLGNAEARHTRIADTQKCLRVSGKHNDLEEVGVDHYHHTMFEMLGNWSFGDYFKQDAIAWAWELLTEVYKLDPDRLYVTVFEGSEEENIPYDREAYNRWLEFVEPGRIIDGNKKDNFWEMGDTGPCGPCSEIHVDMRSDEERSSESGRDLVNTGHPEVIEIWNLVFMEYNRKADGSLEKLPAQHVDTGMGFERLTRALQNKKSNYDTDIFSGIIAETERIAAKGYTGTDEPSDIAFRVIADHIRAVAFCIADGQLPSNNGAGYVLRRILRRAVRYGYSYLGLETPFFHQLVAVMAREMGAFFPELQAQESFIARVIREEEASFYRTLARGMDILEKHFTQGGGDVDGATAFELYDTYGFPLDLTQLIAREHNHRVDLDGFSEKLAEQKARSRADAARETGDWHYLDADAEEDFIGYDFLEAEVRITRWRELTLKGKKQIQVVLSNSPFYAESGGQVGDTGTLRAADGFVVQVLDTVKENQLHICLVDRLPEERNQLFHAEVDKQRRAAIASNHSATHLMHSALRETLGTHVMQKGSLVNPERLRFDFSHFAKPEEAELQQIEDMVNTRIRMAIPLKEERNMPVEEAMKSGAMALFGEKYGDSVRVITFDDQYSKELCGGTHVGNTAHIGFFKLVSESSVAAGVRRMEALTGQAALDYLRQRETQWAQVAELLGNPADVQASLRKMLDEQQALRRRVEAFEASQVQQTIDDLKTQVAAGAGFSMLAARVDLPSAEAARTICFSLQQEHPDLVAMLGFVAQGKPGLALILPENLVAERGWDAAALVRNWAKAIQGGGGGQKFFATAGGKDTSGLDQALQSARSWMLAGGNGS
jgi:alanyl-tRNA synthetase